MQRRLAHVALIAAVLMVGLTTGCRRSSPAAAVTAVQPSTSQPASPPTARTPERQPERSAERDLAADEMRGGHTLARHVGKTDQQLLQRLQRESQISAASTYTDRPTAENVVGAALALGGRAFDTWRRRNGRRPNFVLHFSADRTIGRSLSRGQSSSVPCDDALVVLRWDERRRDFYVLTSYPEANR